jgi:DNA-binding NtrC family response regulator
MPRKEGPDDTQLVAELSPAGPTDVGAPLRGLRFVVIAGPDKGRAKECDGQRLLIGTAQSNDLVLSDPTVSRQHCELLATQAGLLLRDLNSTNGTRLDGCRLESAYLGPGTTIHLGGTVLSFAARRAAPRRRLHDLPSDVRRGRALGRSPSMRRIFSILARVAGHDTTVLLEGETGTGKTLLARTIHQASARRPGPFIVIDCSAIPPTLIETELFGHEKGAFTGASGARIGSFEAAGGGTVFLDEIGELPLDVQPKLLRALEDRVIKRVGSNETVDLDVRVVAATNRDLAEAVRRGTFRSDLYYRLNTVAVRIPPLRDRPEDIAVLAEHFYQEYLGDDDAMLSELLLPELLKRPWPGNARELRSAIERLVVLGHPWPETELEPKSQGERESESQIHVATDSDRTRMSEPSRSERTGDEPSATATSAANQSGRDGDGDGKGGDDAGESSCSFREAKERAIARWEHEYVERLLRRANGNVSQAARDVRMDRNHLRDLVRRRGLDPLTGSHKG